jgi:hypothetical protein
VAGGLLFSEVKDAQMPALQTSILEVLKKGGALRDGETSGGRS